MRLHSCVLENVQNKVVMMHFSCYLSFNRVLELDGLQFILDLLCSYRKKLRNLLSLNNFGTRRKDELSWWYIFQRNLNSWYVTTFPFSHIRRGHWQSINRIKKFPLERDPGLGPSIMIGIFHFIREGNKYRNFVIYNKLCWRFFSV